MRVKDAFWSLVLYFSEALICITGLLSSKIPKGPSGILISRCGTQSSSASKQMVCLLKTQLGSGHLGEVEM